MPGDRDSEVLMTSQVLTAPVCDAIVEAISQGVPLRTAVRAVGLSPDAFYKVLERAKTNDGIAPGTRDMALALIAKLDMARAEWEAKLVQGIQATALDIDSRDSFRAKTWLLNNHPTTRQTYREERRSAVDVQVTDHAVEQVVRVVRELSADELLALSSAVENSE